MGIELIGDHHDLGWSGCGTQILEVNGVAQRRVAADELGSGGTQRAYLVVGIDTLPGIDREKQARRTYVDSAKVVEKKGFLSECVARFRTCARRAHFGPICQLLHVTPRKGFTLRGCYLAVWRCGEEVDRAARGRQLLLDVLGLAPGGSRKRRGALDDLRAPLLYFAVLVLVIRAFSVDLGVAIARAAFR